MARYSTILQCLPVLPYNQLWLLESAVPTPSYAWGRLHHFVELVEAGKDICGQYGTYWRMGYTVGDDRCSARQRPFHTFRCLGEASVWVEASSLNHALG